MSYKNIDTGHQLYIETARNDGHILTPEEQEDNIHIHCRCGGSELKPATQKEIREARDYYNRHNKCKHHLVYDDGGISYYLRYCGICGKLISLV